MKQCLLQCCQARQAGRAHHKRQSLAACNAKGDTLQEQVKPRCQNSCLQQLAGPELPQTCALTFSMLESGV